MDVSFYGKTARATIALVNLALGRMRPLISVLTALLLAALFALAVSRNFEKYTTPSTDGALVHIYLRKVFSIGAFAGVGYLIASLRGRGRGDVLPVTLIVGAFSALIEIGQRLHGEREGLYWNAIDTLCGAAGGFLGVYFRALVRRIFGTGA